MGWGTYFIYVVISTLSSPGDTYLQITSKLFFGFLMARKMTLKIERQEESFLLDFINNNENNDDALIIVVINTYLIM